MSYNSEWDLADHSHAASQHPSPRPRAHASPPPLAPRIPRHSSADNVAREFAREGREGRRRWAATPTGYGSDAGFGVRAMSTFSLPDLAASSSAPSPELHHDSSAPDESSSDAPRPASDPVRYLPAATLPADLDGGPPVRNDTMTPLPHSEERLGAMSLAGLHGQAAVTPQPARPCQRGFFSSEDTVTTTDAGRGHRGPLWGRGGGLSFESQASGHSAGRAGGESYHSDVDIFHGNAVFRHEPVPDSPVAQHAVHRDSARTTPASLPPLPASAESPGPEHRGAEEQETAKDRRRRLLAIPVFPGAPATPESSTPPVARAAPVPAAGEGISTVGDAQRDPDAEVAAAAQCPVSDLPDAAARDDASVSSDDEAHVHRRARAATPAPPTPPLARDDAFPPVDSPPTAGLTQRRNDATAEVVRPTAEPDTPTTPAPRTLGRGRACQDLLWWSLWAYLGLQSREAEGPAPATTAACTAGRYACFAFVYGAACRVVRRGVEYAVAPAQWACEMAVAALRCGAETMLRWPLAAACALQCVLVAQSYADSAQCLAVAWAAGRVASALDDGPDPQAAGPPCPCDDDEDEPAGAGAPMGRRNTSLPHPPPNAALPQPPLLSTTEALTLAQFAPEGPSIVGPAFGPRPASVPRVLEMS